MVLVFVFLAIIILITLFLFLVVASNLRISFENFNFNNTKQSTAEETTESKEAEKYKIKERDKFNIKISLVLFKKITWLFVNLNKEILDKIAKKAHLNKDTLIQLEKDFKPQDFKLLKSLKPKITSLNLDINLGLEDVVITSYLVVGISILISNILPFLVEKEDYNNCKYNVNPIYLNKNLYKISFNCIIEEKMVHIINILFKIIKKGRSDKYERTSNRRSYDYSNEQFAKYG